MSVPNKDVTNDETQDRECGDYSRKNVARIRRARAHYRRAAIATKRSRKQSEESAKCEDTNHEETLARDSSTSSLRAIEKEDKSDQSSHYGQQKSGSNNK